MLIMTNTRKKNSKIIFMLLKKNTLLQMETHSTVLATANLISFKNKCK